MKHWHGFGMLIWPRKAREPGAEELCGVSGLTSEISVVNLYWASTTGWTSGPARRERDTKCSIPWNLLPGRRQLKAVHTELNYCPPPQKGGKCYDRICSRYSRSRRDPSSAWEWSGAGRVLRRRWHLCSGFRNEWDESRLREGEARKAVPAGGANNSLITSQWHEQP